MNKDATIATQPSTAIATDIQTPASGTRESLFELARTEGLRPVAKIMCLGSTLLMLLVDASKCIFWRDWSPVVNYGYTKVFLFYSASSTFFFICCISTISFVKSWSKIYYLCALFFLLSALPPQLYFVQLIPVVWHGIIGFAVATTMAFRRLFMQSDIAWWSVEGNRTKEALEVRKELLKEMQWAISTFTQVWVAISAILGVSMTILFKDGQINIDDRKATAIQLSIAFISALTIAYWGGFAFAMEKLSLARQSLARNI